MKDASTEQQLLSRLSESDKEAFSIIYREYWNELYHEVYIRLHNKEQAEDIIEEIFINLWERRVNLQIDNLSAYLHTVVRYKVYNYVARNKVAETFYEPFDTIVSYSMCADSDLIEKELEQLTEAYIATLPKKRKKIFALYFDENLSTREIAQQLNLSQKTVQNQLGTAIKGLRAQILPVIIFIIYFSFIIG